MASVTVSCNQTELQVGVQHASTMNGKTLVQARAGEWKEQHPYCIEELLEGGKQSGHNEEENQQHNLTPVGMGRKDGKKQGGCWGRGWALRATPWLPLA